MATALFYTPTQIKEDTTVSKNVDEKYLIETILYCQDMYIHPKLGTTFYDELKADIVASTLTGVNKTLMDNYIRPALKWFVVAEAVYETSYKIANKGLVRNDGEHSDAADARALNVVYERYKDKGEWYTQRLIDYLCENETDYPNYQNPGSGTDVIQPERESYTSSIYLGRRGRGYSSLEEKYES